MIFIVLLIILFKFRIKHEKDVKFKYKRFNTISLRASMEKNRNRMPKNKGNFLGQKINFTLL